MRRKILLAVVLIAVVAFGGVGGGLYAASAAGPSLSTQKLVGVGWEGLRIDYSVGGYDYLWRYATDITITNPNDNGDINITSFVVLDKTGNATSKSLYSMNKVLKPHETWSIWLAFYVDDENFEWPEEGPLYLTVPRYTVEVSWNGRVDRPLTGWLKQLTDSSVYTAGQEIGPYVLPIITSGGISESQMVNFTR
jgi:hypothetical protein